MGDTNKYNPANKRFMILVRLITVNWIWFIMAWLTSCTADTNVQVTDITANRMTDHYLCINCLVDEDSTWAETTHWHTDTTCLYSLGMFVSCKDTIKCDTVRVKKLSKKLSELSDRVGPTVISVVNNIGIKRVCEKIKRVM